MLRIIRGLAIIPLPPTTPPGSPHASLVPVASRSSEALAALRLVLSLLGGLQTQAAQVSTPAKAKSVIDLWLAGGVTHHESFDPKPDAPEEIRGTLSTIQTTLPGVQFAEVMPQYGEADR